MYFCRKLEYMKVSISDIINTSKQLLLNPKTFWISKKENLDSQANLLVGFLLPLIGTIALAVFLGEFFRSSHFYVGFAIMKSVRSIILFLLQYFIAVYLTNELIKTFGGEKNIAIVQNLVAYSFTPFLLISIITGIFPFLYVIEILGFYSFYIFWFGVKELLVFSDNRQSSYTIITIVANFFIFSFLSIMLSKLLAAYY